jgi:hypothetical protein
MISGKFGAEQMGGRGSGRHSSFGLMVMKTNEVNSVDLAWLRRKKLLNVGRWSTITWSRRGTEIGSIRIECHATSVRLIYRYRQDGGKWHDISEVVPLIETATRFGGTRQWFQCLACNRRCRILYGGAHFRCRRCHRLKYETQYEPAFARAATRALKIRERLGCKGGIDDPFPPKPKGMHRKTYERLQEQADRLQDAWAEGIMLRWGHSADDG